MFDKFKANHGGYGPLQVAANGLNGLDWHTLAAAQTQWSDTMESLASDPELPDTFKSQLETVRANKYPVSDALSILNQVQQKAAGIKQFNSALESQSAAIEELTAGSTGPRDDAQIAELNRNLKMYHGWATSGDPKLEQAGVQGFAQTVQGIQAFGTTQDAQEIAKVAADEAAAQHYGAENWSRYKDVQADLRTQSQAFVSQREAMERLQATAGLDTAAGQRAALVNAIQVMRPGVVLRNGELLDETAGLPANIQEMYNEITRDGKPTTPEKLKEAYDAAEAAYRAGAADQADRNTRAINAGRAGKVPEDLLNTVAVPTELRDPRPASFGTEMSQEEVRQQTKEAGEAAQQLGAGVSRAVGEFSIGMFGPGVSAPGEWLYNITHPAEWGGFKRAENEVSYLKRQRETDEFKHPTKVAGVIQR